MTEQDLKDIEAQLDYDTTPYYIPALIAEIRRLWVEVTILKVALDVSE